MVQRFKGFYNQKNRCSSARLVGTYHAKCRKIWEMQAVHGEFKSLGSHLGLIYMLLCRTELTARRSKRTHDLAPEQENRWFDLHCDQTRVRSTDTKSGRLGPAGLVTS